MSNSEINIFETYKELKERTGKTEANARSSFEPKHYVCHTVHYKGSRMGLPSWFTRSPKHAKNHQCENRVRDDYEKAWRERIDNMARYVRRYNELHADEFTDLETLRQTSLWRDGNHQRINGYHDVDTSTKYCPLRLKNENGGFYEGIELEITFDGEPCYNGDRYDENGDYDEEGDYDYDGNYIPDYYDEGLDLCGIAQRVLELGKGLFTLEHDGSLAEGLSFEMVSRPLTPNAWHSETIRGILDDVMGYIKDMGGMVEQPKENGFHIHISRKFFERNTNQSQQTIQKDLNWVFQRYQEEIETIGGRMYNCWCRSAKMNAKQNLMGNYGVVVDKAHIDKAHLNLPYSDHSQAFIESSSGYTYEARVFHSTLDVDRILACIEFMRNISHGARDNALEGKTFGQITKYKEAPYLQELIHRIKYQEKKKLALNKRNSNRIEFALAD